MTEECEGCETCITHQQPMDVCNELKSLKAEIDAVRVSNQTELRNEINRILKERMK